MVNEDFKFNLGKEYNMAKVMGVLQQDYLKYSLMKSKVQNLKHQDKKKIYWENKL